MTAETVFWLPHTCAAMCTCVLTQIRTKIMEWTEMRQSSSWGLTSCTILQKKCFSLLGADPLSHAPVCMARSRVGTLVQDWPLRPGVLGSSHHDQHSWLVCCCLLGSVPGTLDMVITSERSATTKGCAKHLRGIPYSLLG